MPSCLCLRARTACRSPLQGSGGRTSQGAEGLGRMSSGADMEPSPLLLSVVPEETLVLGASDRPGTARHGGHSSRSSGNFIQRQSSGVTTPEYGTPRDSSSARKSNHASKPSFGELAAAPGFGFVLDFRRPSPQSSLPPRTGQRLRTLFSGTRSREVSEAGGSGRPSESQGERVVSSPMLRHRDPSPSRPHSSTSDPPPSARGGKTRLLVGRSRSLGIGRWLTPSVPLLFPSHQTPGGTPVHASPKVTIPASPAQMLDFGEQDGVGLRRRC